ncbi:Adaptive-response sensory-kinase SasA [Candidatus Methanoperedenaceae archaeon GB50]|nr:Adaptive-response sensory-kinase SasA [Candidatus Methanoperedenaceae archaeon GB50]
MSIFPLINSLICAILAIFVLSRNARHPLNLSFSLGLFSLGFIEMANFIALRSILPLFWIRMARVGECLLPANWILFIYAFAKKDRQILTKDKLVISIFYATSLFFMAFSQKEFFITPLSDFLFRIERLGYYFYLFLCFSMIFILSKLEGILFSSKGAVRWQIKYAMLGLGSIFASFIFITGQRLLYRTIDLHFIPIHSVIILISLFLIVFASVRRHFLDVDVFVSRYAVYTSLTVIFVGIYFLSLGLMGELARKLGIDLGYLWEIPIIFVSVLILSIVLLSDTVKRKVRYFISRHFYKDKYDYRAQWLNFSNRLSNKFTASEICNATLELLSEAMYVKQLSIWLYDEENESLQIASSKGLAKVDFKVEHKDFISSLKNRPFILKESLKKENSKVYEENREFFEKARASLCVPMIVGDNFIGIIAIGPEFSGKGFIQDDFDLLTSIAAQASNALLNVRLSDKLIQIREQETFHRLSSFIVHDLKNLVYTLSLSLQNARKYFDEPEFKKDLLDTISNSVSKMKVLMAKLSSAPRGLKINLQQIDLNNLINEVVDSTKLNSKDINIKKYFGDIPVIKADKEQLKKVITNLMLNALEANGNRGEIKINTYSRNGWVVFSISDNGPGMDKEFKEKYLFKPFHSTKSRGLGIGLFQCKTIIDAHKGRIEVESEKWKGCTFTVKLPV